MAARSLDYLHDGEASALAYFFVEMVALDEHLSSLLLSHFAPQNEKDFIKAFLDRMNWDTKVRTLADIDKARDPFDQRPIDGLKENRRELDRLAKVRNSVAHRLPRTEYERDEDGEYDVYNVYEVEGKPLPAAALLKDAKSAAFLRSRLRYIPADSLF